MTKEELELLGKVQEIMKDLCDRKKGKRSVCIVLTEDFGGIASKIKMEYPPKSGNEEIKN